ncbi:hypothetical protein EV196_11156 [Mariniflexile fucanivorans]|uniref:Uncharacterized protein n=1 Tax=Mariniflexile fucanivorans TaxID=264023 RepID=A0A4R1RB68_9FLAO|nr:hypothetical protein [Mariniflexile fucanivorans]TCL62860.1 hypothetical protein EV196_11156 [Mariniflexile fucanivorans]
MISNYINNLLNKNSQRQNVVEPRLKSRFEDAAEATYNEPINNTSETENTSFQEYNPIDERASEEMINGSRKVYQTIHSEEKNIENISKSQNQFLNTIEKHFHSSDYNGEEIKEKSTVSTASQLKNVGEEPTEKPYYKPNETKENKSYGILNKPVMVTNKTEIGFKENNDTMAQQKAAPTSVQPSIKISIGKIEVKAVKASPKTPLKPKAQPNLKLSLDDYINKRK